MGTGYKELFNPSGEDRTLQNGLSIRLDTLCRLGAKPRKYNQLRQSSIAHNEAAVLVQET